MTQVLRTLTVAPIRLYQLRRLAASCRRTPASTTRAAPSTRCSRSASAASCAACRSPRGGCFAATRGRTEVSTTRDAALLDPVAARERDEVDPRLLPRLRRAPVGVVDRRADRAGADPARAADGAADPLDAVAPGARAGDEGDPAEVQGRPHEAERGADEVLQGEPHQPGRVVPAAARAVPGLHRALLHAQEQHEAHHRLVAARRPEHRRQGRRRTGRATCCSRCTPARRSRRRTSWARRWTRRSATS